MGVRPRALPGLRRARRLLQAARPACGTAPLAMGPGHVRLHLQCLPWRQPMLRERERRVLQAKGEGVCDVSAPAKESNLCE